MPLFWWPCLLDVSLNERLCSGSISVEQNILALKNTMTWLQPFSFLQRTAQHPLWCSSSALSLVNCERGNDLFTNVIPGSLKPQFILSFSKIMLYCLKEKNIPTYIYLVLFDSEVLLNMFCQDLKESVLNKLRQRRTFLLMCYIVQS